MSEENKYKEVQFKISQLKEIDFYVKDISEKEQINFLTDSVNTTIGLNFQQSKNEIFTISFHIGYKYKEEIDILKMNWSISFFIQNLNEIIQFKDGNLNVDTQILINFVNIGYGTLRGIIAEKTKGMFLNQFYLPVIDVHKLLPAQK